MTTSSTQPAPRMSMRALKAAAVVLVVLLFYHAAHADGAASEQELGTLYATYFAQGNLDGVLSLYNLEGSDAQTIEQIKKINSEGFGTAIAGIKYVPVIPNPRAFWYVAPDGGALMIPTVQPVRQMLVRYKTTPPRTDGALGVPTMYTIIGKKDNRYYLVAFKRGPRR